MTLLRWIDHLSRLGRVTETTERVEAAAIEAMRQRNKDPYLGGRPLPDGGSMPAGGHPVLASDIGYLQHLDTAALSRCMEKRSLRIYVLENPGAFIDPSKPVAIVVDGPLDDDLRTEILGSFTIGTVRSFDQDPRFGAIVLSEIASRALSPGVNDPGTAIDVIGRAVRLLAVWAQTAEELPDVKYPRIYVPPIEIHDLFDDLFTPMARDGAPTIEIGIRLQKALRTLSEFKREGFHSSARRHSREAMERAEAALAMDTDRAKLRLLAL